MLQGCNTEAAWIKGCMLHIQTALARNEELVFKQHLQMSKCLNSKTEYMSKTIMYMLFLHITTNFQQAQTEVENHTCSMLVWFLSLHYLGKLRLIHVPSSIQRHKSNLIKPSLALILAIWPLDQHCTCVPGASHSICIDSSCRVASPWSSTPYELSLM